MNRRAIAARIGVAIARLRDCAMCYLSVLAVVAELVDDMGMCLCVRRRCATFVCMCVSKLVYVCAYGGALCLRLALPQLFFWV